MPVTEYGRVKFPSGDIECSAQLAAGRHVPIACADLGARRHLRWSNGMGILDVLGSKGDDLASVGGGDCSFHGLARSEPGGKFVSARRWRSRAGTRNAATKTAAKTERVMRPSVEVMMSLEPLLPSGVCQVAGSWWNTSIANVPHRPATMAALTKASAAVGSSIARPPCQIKSAEGISSGHMTIETKLIG